MMARLRSLGVPAGAGLAILGMMALDLPRATVALAASGLALTTQQLAARRRAGGPQGIDADAVVALRRREEQLAHTAHELRTPLTAVTTALELLRDGYAASADDCQDYLEQATVAARHMAFLINDVVDLAAIESGRLSLQVRAHRVQDLVFDVTQVMALTAQRRQVRLAVEEVPPDLQVCVDRGRYLQILFNLVANAIKFSPPGRPVHLRVQPLDDLVRFEVDDHGPGIPPEQRERLFTRFGRVHAASMPAVPGSGLGLHVCKLLVEHMGGHIGHRPGAEHGSVFWFTLPREAAEGQPAAVAPRQPATA